jgi:hypothetical protein
MKLFNNYHLFCLGTFLIVSKSEAFSSSTKILPSRRVSSLAAYSSKNHKNVGNNPGFACVIAATIFTNVLFPGMAFADEIGREVEAPTLLTGETVEVGFIIDQQPHVVANAL